ncbi:hypothetical protein [Moorena sp. SIO4A5]|uniref:hypothetical protein n=1 Tax=Moorena sp. SIO4A5 TaxID=2607838 RepID=UPI0013C805E0|nr:hypothetical protein [Moorena sp. SIO4A5]NEO24145.1 hypothetical protein [Moorena sp. SIO4A5]
MESVGSVGSMGRWEVWGVWGDGEFGEYGEMGSLGSNWLSCSRQLSRSLIRFVIVMSYSQCLDAKRECCGFCVGHLNQRGDTTVADLSPHLPISPHLPHLPHFRLYSQLPIPRECGFRRRIKFATGRTAPDSRLPTPCSRLPKTQPN